MKIDSDAKIDRILNLDEVLSFYFCLVMEFNGKIKWFELIIKIIKWRLMLKFTIYIMKRYKRNGFLTSIKMNVWESWMINVIETITNNENVQIFSWGRHLISIEVNNKIKLDKV